MSRPAYADAGDYESWSGLPSNDGTDRLLTRASELLDNIVTRPFPLEEDGLPLDVEDATALREAACAQVRFWTETGEEHDIDGLAGTDVSIGGVSGKRPPVVAPQALRILKEALLL